MTFGLCLAESSVRFDGWLFLLGLTHVTWDRAMRFPYIRFMYFAVQNKFTLLYDELVRILHPNALSCQGCLTLSQLLYKTRAYFQLVIQLFFELLFPDLSSIIFLVVLSMTHKIAFFRRFISLVWETEVWRWVKWGYFFIDLQRKGYFISLIIKSVGWRVGDYLLELVQLIDLGIRKFYKFSSIFTFRSLALARRLGFKNWTWILIYFSVKLGLAESIRKIRVPLRI